MYLSEDCTKVHLFILMHIRLREVQDLQFTFNDTPSYEKRAVHLHPEVLDLIYTV